MQSSSYALDRIAKALKRIADSLEAKQGEPAARDVPQSDRYTIYLTTDTVTDDINILGCSLWCGLRKLADWYPAFADTETHHPLLHVLQAVKVLSMHQVKDKSILLVTDSYELIRWFTTGPIPEDDKRTAILEDIARISDYHGGIEPICRDKTLLLDVTREEMKETKEKICLQLSISQNTK